ncbi:hypothetical protein DAI22_02g099200 [Oryza sativa Japonica Group]|nr:hypothetical protein DAI22_02g099200 [Oryza sativa Japonica Group]
MTTTKASIKRSQSPWLRRQLIGEVYAGHTDDTPSRRRCDLRRSRCRRGHSAAEVLEGP